MLTQPPDQTPAGRPRPWFRRKKTDEEYVAKIEADLLRWDRWKWLGILLHVAAIGGVIWVGFNLIELIESWVSRRLNQNPNQIAKEIIIVGGGIGASAGFTLGGSMQAILTCIFGRRSDRLLVEYSRLLQPPEKIRLTRSNGDADLQSKSHDRLSDGPG